MLPNGRTILSLVQSLRAIGGDVIISFGGANGDEPALHCPDPTSLAGVYQSVINRYEAKALDFDIEGDKALDQTSIQRRNLALVALRAANPGLTISYTLPVLPSGLDDNGVGVLTSAKRDGLDPDVINVLAMNYGASVDNGGQMGRDALMASSNTALQVKAAGLTSRIGVTPMIGFNDVSPEVFTLADASVLASFAASNAYIARLSTVVRWPRQRLLRRLRRCSLDLQRHRPVALRVFCDLRGEVAPNPGVGTFSRTRGAPRAPSISGYHNGTPINNPTPPPVV